MTDTLSITGIAATTPRRVTTSTGLDIASFRVASVVRRYDQESGRWVNGDTNWYTINAFRDLAVNVFTSVEKGDRVIVTGALRIRDWTTDDNHGTSVEIDADSIGHDLAWGTSQFTRTHPASRAAADQGGGTGEEGTDTTPPASEAVQA